MKGSIALSLVLFTLTINCGIHGYAQEVNFMHYTVKEGISQSEIKCIFQDSEGFLWFGTQNGLNKFDGYTFEKFFHSPADSSTLSSNWIFGITEDAAGFLWIATKKGLNRYDKKTGKFARIDHKLTGSVVHDEYVYGIAADDTCIYINTPPSLSLLHLKSGTLETCTNQFEYDGILHDFGYPILKSSDGLIWIGTSHGLCYFDPDSRQFKNFRHNVSDPRSISNDHITALNEDQHGNLLVGTENGLNLYHRNDQHFMHWFHEQGNDNSLSNSSIRSIYQDHTGAFWIGTDAGGLNKMIIGDNQQATFTHFRNLGESPQFISHDIVYALYEDKSKNLWIGTIAGIDKLDLKKKKFRHYRRSADPGSINLLDNVIASIYKDPDGRLWIGNWNKGLNVYDRHSHRMEYYSSARTGKKHIPGDNVHVIFRDSKSRIWLGTRNGVCVFNAGTGQFELFQDYFGIAATDYFNGNRVYCIIEDAEGKIWMGTGNGIFILDIQAKSTRLIQAGIQENGPAISNNLVYSLLEDRKGHIWIATSDGLDRFVPEENRILHYRRDPSSGNTLCDNYTISLCEDLRGNIWIGTSTGINRFNTTDSVFTHYSMNEGLPSNIIYDILEDDQHNLWFTTGNGLVRYNTSSDIIRSYTLEEGVRGMEFNIKAVFKAEDGELFFGGMDGFISFYPDSLVDNDYLPPLKITSFEKENNGIRSRLNIYQDEVILSYRDYSFTIEFSALDYSDPSKNQYTYQLEPLSDKWINIGNRRFVHFTNLPPGKYYFRVRGTNNDGFWNPEGTGITIRIYPPWWKSTYAYVSYVFFLALAVVFIIRWRGKKLVEEKKVLEQKVQDRTEELVRQKNKLDELNTTKDKFFSILAHDLKGPFSSLYAVSDLLSQQYDAMEDADKRAGMKKIQKSAELIFRLLENLLVWARSQRGGIVFSPVRFNLSRIVEVNINLHRPAAAEKKIMLRNNVPDDVYAFGDMEMIDTVLRNLINNAVKFTPFEKEVGVEIREDDKFLQVMVKDQGVGISAENMEKLFRIDVKHKTTGTAGETGTGLGLVLCREFVEKNGGRIWLESQEYSGTVFYFTVPRPLS